MLSSKEIQERKREVYNKYDKIFAKIEKARNADTHVYMRCVNTWDAHTQHDPYIWMRIRTEKAMYNELKQIDIEASKPGLSNKAENFDWDSIKKIIDEFYGDGTLNVYDKLMEAYSSKDIDSLTDAVQYAREEIAIEYGCQDLFSYVLTMEEMLEALE